MGIYGVWIGRIVAGFAFAIVLTFVGDIGGRVVNLLLGYPWHQDVHFTMQLVSIGLAAGIGAQLGWINLGLSRYWSLGMWAVVCAAAIVGVYMGYAYGPGVDTTYWWSRFALDTTIHISAAVAGTVAAAVIGITKQSVDLHRSQSRARLTSMTATSVPSRADDLTPSN